MSGEQILTLAAVIFTLIGTIITGVFAWLNRRGGEKAASVSKQTPSWTELHTAYLDLREEITRKDEERVKADAEKQREVNEIKERLERLEKTKRTREWAASHVMREASSQWPVGAPGPELSPQYTDPIIDLLPYQWRPAQVP